MTQTRTPTPANAPWLVRATTPITNRFMRLGLPMGPTVLLIVRGRTSRLPRTAPVAVVEIDSWRYVIGAYGDVQWVRNLRTAGETSIRLGRRDAPVSSRELRPDEALTFFAETVPGSIRRFPTIGAHVCARAVRSDRAADPQRSGASRNDAAGVRAGDQAKPGLTVVGRDP